MPLIDNTTKIPKQKFSERNALHDFASYNCLFTLSGCNENLLGSQRQFLTAPLRNIIARSSGIGDQTRAATVDQSELVQVGPTTIKRTLSEYEKQLKIKKILNDPEYVISGDILDRNHDIFFENVNIISTVGPNNERNLANFTKMTFELHEPYGVTFTEKIRAAAFREGYKDYQAAPYLLTIEWKGFDENGNPIPDRSKSLERRVPIFITRVEFEVNAGGTVYTCTAVPYSEMAFDDSFKFPRTEFATNVTTVAAWIGSVNVGLKEQMQQEVDGGFRTYHDKYTFDISEIEKFIKNGDMVTEETEGIFNTADVKESMDFLDNDNIVGPDDSLLAQNIAQVKAKRTGMHLDKYTSLVKAFEDVIRSTTFYQDITGNFWKNLVDSSNKSDKELVGIILDSEKLADTLGKNQYVDWFMIKPRVKSMVEKGLDPITKMYPKEIIYKAIPYKVHILKLLMPGMSLGKIDWSKYARRQYEYIYTGDNVDVQNLRINYNTGYYYRNIRDDDESAGSTGKFRSIANAIKKAFGAEDYPEPALPLRQYPSVLKQVNFAKKISPKNAKAQEFFDYLVNPEADMMKIELEILGDPAYVAQDIFAPYEDKILQGEEYDFQRNSFNMQSHMPVVHLNYRMPTDLREKEGTMFDKQFLESNLFFSGGYQVTRIDSSMNQGQFTQTLTMVRLNNQDGEGSAPKELMKAANGGLDKIMTPENIKDYYREKFFSK